MLCLYGLEFCAITRIPRNEWKKAKLIIELCRRLADRATVQTKDDVKNILKSSKEAIGAIVDNQSRQELDRKIESTLRLVERLEKNPRDMDLKVTDITVGGSFSATLDQATKAEHRKLLDIENIRQKVEKKLVSAPVDVDFKMQDSRAPTFLLADPPKLDNPPKFDKPAVFLWHFHSTDPLNTLVWKYWQARLQLQETGGALDLLSSLSLHFYASRDCARLQRGAAGVESLILSDTFADVIDKRGLKPGKQLKILAMPDHSSYMVLKYSRTESRLFANFWEISENEYILKEPSGKLLKATSLAETGVPGRRMDELRNFMRIVCHDKTEPRAGQRYVLDISGSEIGTDVVPLHNQSISAPSSIPPGHPMSTSMPRPRPTPTPTPTPTLTPTPTPMPVPVVMLVAPGSGESGRGTTRPNSHRTFPSTTATAPPHNQSISTPSPVPARNGYPTVMSPKQQVLSVDISMPLPMVMPIPETVMPVASGSGQSGRGLQTRRDSNRTFSGISFESAISSVQSQESYHSMQSHITNAAMPMPMPMPIPVSETAMAAGESRRGMTRHDSNRTFSGTSFESAISDGPSELSVQSYHSVQSPISSTESLELPNAIRMPLPQSVMSIVQPNIFEACQVSKNPLVTGVGLPGPSTTPPVVTLDSRPPASKHSSVNKAHPPDSTSFSLANKTGPTMEATRAGAVVQNQTSVKDAPVAPGVDSKNEDDQPASRKRWYTPIVNKVKSYWK
ncbi:hypothetical protein D9758_004986 [Tetrapyrgos nigripes]|uniref:Uncharacterized protein n=1 Tax=Tetrapyrgos nigripes TaxID=182062 RepID=A0A8H5LWL5_9AGAR|nr:hypothetical protein D9758_004986 [Tetrapyrgos nigripes]